MPTPDEFNPLAPETVEDPFAFYAALREHAPVYQSPLGFFIVSRYRDAVDVLNHEVSSPRASLRAWIRRLIRRSRKLCSGDTLRLIRC